MLIGEKLPYFLQYVFTGKSAGEREIGYCRAVSQPNCAGIGRCGMNGRLSRKERGAFLFFGGTVILLTIFATPSILIVTLLDYLLNKRPEG
jgi:hypothetical protein